MSNENATALRNAAATVYLPGDDGYDEARSVWAAGQNLRPAAVALPRTAEEVASVVRAAAANGLKVSPLGTGHNAYPLPDLSETVLLRMSRFDSVEIRPQERIARAGGGTVWLPVAEAAQQHHLAAMHGSAVDVGVAGYLTNGGLSWYARQYGLAANHVTAIEIVRADGSLVRADAEHEEELFWAVRGGGGNFGVVTAIEFGLLPYGSAYAGMLGWDLTEAPRVLERWRQWTGEVPDRVTSAYRHTQFPPIPQIPEPFRGRQWVIIDGAVLAEDDEAERILAPLRELRPELDTWTRIPASAVPRIHLDPEGPVDGAADAALIDGLPQAAVDKMLELTGPGSGMGLVAAELRHLGGALARPSEKGGATSWLDGQYNALAAGAVMDAEGKAAVLAEAKRFVAAMSENNARGKHYLGLHQGIRDARSGFDEATWQRLTALREKFDPDHVFLANHVI
jgi:FAD/FMN-containing dehydrogenase